MKCSITDDVALKSIDITDLKRKIKNIKVYAGLPRTKKELINRIGDSEIAVFDLLTKIDKEVIDACPNLQYLVAASTGYQNVDIDYAKRKGIVVSNCPEIFTRSVAEFVLFMMLNLSRNFVYHIDNAKRGVWSFNTYSGYELYGKTLGVIGAGKIGREVIRIGKALGMKVIVNTLRPSRQRAKELGIGEFVALEELLKQSDFISINVKTNSTSKGLINSKNMKLLKKGVCIINTSTNEEFDLKSAYKYIKSGVIRGLGLDSIKVMPQNWEDKPQYIKRLIKEENVLITPDLAWNTIEGVARLKDSVINNIYCWMQGNPVNVVNGKF